MYVYFSFCLKLLHHHVISLPKKIAHDLLFIVKKMNPKYMNHTKQMKLNRKTIKMNHFLNKKFFIRKKPLREIKKTGQKMI